MFWTFENSDLEFARPVKYGMTYFWFDFHDSFGKVRSSISNRITQQGENFDIRISDLFGKSNAYHQTPD